jgi:hypothetical protein
VVSLVAGILNANPHATRLGLFCGRIVNCMTIRATLTLIKGVKLARDTAYH